MRRVPAGLCIVMAVIAVGCAVAFTATIAHGMDAVNAANHWAANNPDHEALSPVEYLTHAVPGLILLGALLVCFGRARATPSVGLVLIWLSSVCWAAGFLLYAMFVEHSPDSSYFLFAGSAFAGLICAIASVAARWRRRPANAGSLSPAQLSE